MRVAGFAVIGIAVAVALTAWPVAAQDQPATTHKHPKTRVVVVKRSYLDAGTEVLPGQRKDLDYVFPPGYIGRYQMDLWHGGDVPWAPDPFYPGVAAPQ